MSVFVYLLFVGYVIGAAIEKPLPRLTRVSPQFKNVNDFVELLLQADAAFEKADKCRVLVAAMEAVETDHRVEIEQLYTKAVPLYEAFDQSVRNVLSQGSFLSKSYKEFESIADRFLKLSDNQKISWVEVTQSGTEVINAAFRIVPQHIKIVTEKMTLDERSAVLLGALHDAKISHSQVSEMLKEYHRSEAEVIQATLRNTEKVLDHIEQFGDISDDLPMMIDIKERDKTKGIRRQEFAKSFEFLLHCIRVLDEVISAQMETSDTAFPVASILKSQTDARPPPSREKILKILQEHAEFEMALDRAAQALNWSKLEKEKSRSIRRFGFSTDSVEREMIALREYCIKRIAFVEAQVDLVGEVNELLDVLHS